MKFIMTKVLFFFSIFILFSKILISNVFAAPTFVHGFSVNSQETNPAGLAFSSDGTKMFHVGNIGSGNHAKTNADVFEYALSTPWDVSSATYVDAFSVIDEMKVDNQSSLPYGITFNNDGTQMYVSDYGITDSIYQYTLSRAYDVSTASYANKSIDVDAKVGSANRGPCGIRFNNDGTKLFVAGFSDSQIYEFTLSTAFDISTASYVDGFDVSAQGNRNRDFEFNPDGTIMFAVNGPTDGANVYEIFEYKLTTAFDISTASYVNKVFNTRAQDDNTFSIAISNDGSKLYMLGYGSDNVNEYTLSCYYGINSCTDPTSDKDDVASVEAQTEAAKKLIQHTTYPILNRMEWLRRNTDNANLTNQNIKFQFSNTVLESLSNLIPAYLNNEATTPELKELEIMRDKRKKLISENAELEAQNEKLKLLAKQNLLAKQKDQENKANNWSFWSEGTVSFGKIGDSIISSAKKIKTSAITVGLDKKIDSSRMFGMALRVGGDDIDFGDVKNSLDLDTVSLTLYESFLFGKNKFIDSLIGLGTFKTDIVNAVGFSSTDATRDGKQVFASFKVRETFKNDKLNFTPNVKIDLGFSTLSDYVEEGPANLKFNRQNIGTIITSIGGTLDNIIDLNGGTLKPFLEMDYYADISPSSEQKISYKNDETTTYKLVDIKGSTHNLKGKLGFDFITHTGWTFTSSYQRIQNKGNGYSDGFYLEVNYLPSKDTEYSMSLDNDKASLDYKKNIKGLDLTIGSNYSLVSEIPDYAAYLEISNTF